MKKTRKHVITNKTKFTIPILLLSLALVFTCCVQDVSAAPGDTMYVNGSSGNDTNDGYSWITAKLSIGNATGTVNENGAVNIADGTYTGENNTNININKNMTIKGQSQQNTIINGTNTAQIFTIATGKNVTIQNLTLTNGHGNFGGAIFNDGTLTVTNSTLIGNTASWGGAINNNFGTLTVTNSTLNNNAASYAAAYGGAIYNLSGNLTVTNSTLNNNTANCGGAMYSWYGTLTVTNSTLIGNTASWGGAINNNFGTLTVTNSTLNNNAASYAAAYGGAIYNQYGTLTVSNSTLTGNTANCGGTIYSWYGTLTVTNSTLNNNTVYGDGGAIYNDGGDATVNFNRIVGNTAPIGSAIYCPSGTVNAQNNWWGSNAGPTGQIIGSVSADPWLVLKVDVSPNGFNPALGSTIIADLTYNSNSVDTSAQGHVPDGIEATFSSTPVGYVSPASDTTVNGKAETTFTPPVSGKVTVHTTIDGQTVDTILGEEYDIYVSDTRGHDDTGNGSYTNPYKTISKGITEVHADGRVHIENGTYIGNDNKNIAIDKNLTIIGESQTGTITDAQNNGRIFTINSGRTVTIQNLTLTNGQATNGGAINNAGTLTVNDCTFTSNTASGIYPPNGIGGAIVNDFGTLTVNNCTFTGNTAYASGAIDNHYGIMTVNNCTFTGNNATYGGAINSASLLNVYGSSFTGNNATYGGAIGNDPSGTLTVKDSIFIGNTADHGGAIYNNQHDANITDSNFTGNTVPSGNLDFRGGGAIDNYYGTMNVNGCTFTNNIATNNGGGAIINFGDLNVENSTFTSNTGAEGGAIYGYSNTLKVKGSTFIDNTATLGLGGAIRNIYSTVEVQFNRIVGNSPSNIEISNLFGTVDATLNWWGSNVSPAGKVQGNVAYNPWIILTITADPTTINNGGTSQVKADLLHDNTGTYHEPELGHVPDEIPIKLTVPWGSFTNPVITHSISLNTVNGSVKATFYANEGSAPASNPVKVTATADGYTTTDTESAYITILKVANLSVTKTDSPDPVFAGNPLIYTVTIINNGPDSADGVTLDDVISNISAFKSGTLQYRFKMNDSSWSTWTSFINPLHLDLGTVLNGKTAVIEINGTIDPSTSKNTVINNTATADTTTTPGPKVATSTTTVDTQADLVVGKSGPATVIAGNQLTYTVTVANNGPSDAQNVVVQDVIPAVLQDVTHDSFNLGTIGAGQTRTVTITGKVPSSTALGTVIENNATVTSDTTGTITPSSKVSTTVNTQSVLNVVEESLISPVVAGVTYTDPIYRITVTNNGPSDARDVQVQDNLPDQIVNREYRINTGSWISFTGALNQVIPYLACGASDVIEIRGSIPSSVPAGSMSNMASASVYGTSFNSNLVNTAIIAIADVDLTKWVNDFRPDVGELVTFTVKACNHGPSDATNVLIKDEMPLGFEDLELSVPAGTVYANGMWIIPCLKSGEEAVLTFEGRVTPCMAGKVTTNIATKIHQTEEDPDAIDTAGVAIYVPKSDLYIWMKANKNNPQIGEIVNITVKLGNRGPNEAKYAEITIPLPEGFEFIDATGNGIWSYNAGTITWILKNVEVGDPYLHITGRIVSPGDLTFKPSIFSETYNANTQGVNPLTIHAQSPLNPSSTVKAANKTVGMQKTGTPINYLILAILVVISGLIPKRK